jgi:hypothetical protein
MNRVAQIKVGNHLGENEDVLEKAQHDDEVGYEQVSGLHDNADTRYAQSNDCSD